jgi:hypothetical protein
VLNIVHRPSPEVYRKEGLPRAKDIGALAPNQVVGEFQHCPCFRSRCCIAGATLHVKFDYSGTREIEARAPSKAICESPCSVYFRSRCCMRRCVLCHDGYFGCDGTQSNCAAPWYKTRGDINGSSIRVEAAAPSNSDISFVFPRGIQWNSRDTLKTFCFCQKRRAGQKTAGRRHRHALVDECQVTMDYGTRLGQRPLLPRRSATVSGLVRRLKGGSVTRVGGGVGS